MKPMKNTLKIAVSTAALSALAGSAFAADFATLDANTDGQVDFSEYKIVALAEGKSVTLAAQEFTRMAQGDAVLTEDEFFLANALAGQPYALQPNLISEPMPYESIEKVTSVEIFESYPEKVEAIEPPVIEDTIPPVEMMEKAAPEPVISETTPVEEGGLDLPEVETPELEDSETVTDETDIKTGEIY